MSVARFAFGPRLKAHRERRGVTLQDIAESTKISVSLLANLERNDVSHWPNGIYRRAFLRSYTRAIDIPFEPVWAEFAQLFPEEGAEAPAATSGFTPTQLRLTFASRSSRLQPVSRRSLTAAAADSVLIVLSGLAVAFTFGISPWMTIAIVGLLYFSICTVLFGESLSLRYVRAPRRRAISETDGHVPVLHDAAADVQAAVNTDEPAGANEATGTVIPSPVVQRPRMFAIPPAHVAARAHAQERRVADR